MNHHHHHHSKMKMTIKTLLTMTALMAMVSAAPAQEVKPGPRARPTAEQAAWHDMDLEMFIHFGPATWENVQHSNLTAPLSAINPEKLDTDQWADVAVKTGAKQIIFVAKHDGGFCWWQTDTTEYSVKNTPWRGGKGDVVKDLAESCRKRGVKLGIYLSPADRKHGIVPGGKAQTPAEQERYNKIYRQQLTELLSRYGEISEVWFDGSIVVPVDDILKRYTPKAMILQGPRGFSTIRWVGNEEGEVRYPMWNALPAEKANVGATGYDSDPGGEAWQPMECDARIRRDWFWSRENAPTLKTVNQLMNMYYRSVGYGAVLLLNQTPDTSGLIPESDVRRAAEFGAEINKRFGTSVAETAGKGESIELDLGHPAKIDHVITMEEIMQGERVREYAIEGLAAGQWRQLCEGTAIGHKKIDRFAPVEVSKIRLRIHNAVGEPLIKNFAAYSVYGDKAPDEMATELATKPVMLGKWSEQNVKNDWTTMNLDLTPFCKDAGVYMLEFVPDGGKELDVQSISLLARGQKLENTVRRRNFWGHSVYDLTISEEHAEYALQAVLRLPLDAPSHGRLMITRR